jgi:hypothetical protein
LTVPAVPYPEQSQATTILVLGILSIVCSCFPVGIIAWIMGNNELRAIDEGRRPPENRGTANAGRICGIVGVGLTAIGLLFLFTGALASFPFFEGFGR